ncbi:MAG TPA: UDP binding domain-containing protein, partial [Mucilaginibacter sp.]|nr:UDP binding domain-containing protein [Mucilaginibacter sp.]
IDIIKILQEFEAQYTVYDPWADPEEVLKEYGIYTIKEYDKLNKKFDAIILAVSHTEFLTLHFNELKKTPASILYDIKGILNTDIIDGRL